MNFDSVGQLVASVVVKKDVDVFVVVAAAAAAVVAVSFSSIFDADHRAASEDSFLPDLVVLAYCFGTLVHCRQRAVVHTKQVIQCCPCCQSLAIADDVGCHLAWEDSIS